MDKDLRALERRWRETGDPIDGSALERALYRAGRVGYVPSSGDLQRFGPSQAGLHQVIRDDVSGLSQVLHPRVVLADGSFVYRMLRSDEVMNACLADPLLLKKRRWSAASFLMREDGSFEVRPYCPFLVTIQATDDRYVWPLGEVDGVLGPVGVGRGEEGRDYWVCDGSDERYSPDAQGRYRPLPKAVAKSLPAWLALAGGNETLLSDFADLQYSVLKQDYGCDEGMGCWVSESPGLRAVAFDSVSNLGDAVGGDIDLNARSLRVAPINASPQGEPQVRTQARR